MSKRTQSNGIGFFGALFLVFLVLKLTGNTVVATWSWWWVTAPLWLPASIGISIMGITALILFLLALIVGKR